MLPIQPRAVVTGAASGLGRALALQLADRRARLVLSDLDEDALDETVRLVEARGGTANARRCDVADAAAMEDFARAAQDTLGAVDLVVNNAGVAVGGAVGEIPLADWEWIVGVNLRGVVHGCHFFLPAMKRRGAGHILNVASIAGFASAPMMGPYNATKAAVIALSETLAAELQGTGVGCTVLCPYFFRTNIAASARNSSEQVSTDFIHKLMDRTRVQAEDVARLALKGCDDGDLYVFPHLKAKVIQAVKRALPDALHGPLTARLLQRLSRR